MSKSEGFITGFFGSIAATLNGFLFMTNMSTEPWRSCELAVARNRETIRTARK